MSASTLRAGRRRDVAGRRALPIGFICDHIEVLYDLDTEAAEVAAHLDLAMARARAVNNHPRFAEAMAQVVRSTIYCAKTGTAAPSGSARKKGPLMVGQTISHYRILSDA